MQHSWQPGIGRPISGRFVNGRVAVAVAAVSTTVTIAFLVGHDFIDLLVYRTGAQVLLDGDDLYGAMPPVVDDFGLPFTYPPLAAILFVPLALLPLVLAQTVFTAASIGALAVTLRLVLGRLRPELGSRAAWTVTTASLAVALPLEPVRETIGFGQINLILMALVAVDVLTDKPWWPRGLLIGLAAAIKLTPIAFLLLFLVKRDWKTSGSILVSAGGSTALAFAVLPDVSMKYWLHTLPDTGRIGAAYYAGNESLEAVVARFAPPEPAASLLWLLAVAVMLAVAVVAIRRTLDRGDLVQALLANATAVLLASPVSWSHHWVWAAPALLMLATAVGCARSPRTLAFGFALVVLFLIGPHHLLPMGEDRELDWALWQHVLGSLYVLVGFGYLLCLALRQERGVTGETVRQPSTGGENPARLLDTLP